VENKNYGGYGHLLDDGQKKEVDKVKEAVGYINQNIKMAHKLNEANHDYQVMRKKATRRIKRKATLFDIERKAEERLIQSRLGVESYLGESRKEVIFWGVITAGFWAVIAYFVWVTL
jgi:hypothetical protein